MTDLNIDDCINETCPWSGKPVQADSLALYDKHFLAMMSSDSAIRAAATSLKARSILKKRGRRV